MKHLIIIGMCIAFFSCTNKNEKPTILSGKIENASGEKEINLFGYSINKKIALEADGSFIDTLAITEPEYFNVSIGQNYTPIYIKPGSTLNITTSLNDFNDNLVFKGEEAKENTFFVEGNKISQNDRKTLFTKDETNFLKAIEEKKYAIEALLKKDSYSKEFAKDQLKSIKYVQIASLINYEDGYKYLTKDTTFTTSDEFKKIRDSFSDYENAKSFRKFSTYRNLTHNYFSGKSSKLYEKTKDYGQAMLTTYGKIENKLIQNSLMHSASNFIISGDDFEDKYNKLMAFSTNEEHKKEYTEIYEKLKRVAKGNPSPTFNYENVNGDKISLASLKGKYVYIDLWATWCGPCKLEIPHLKTLEKEYHDANINFVSISVDERKNIDKWKKMVEEKELIGIQLITENGWNSQLVKDYNVSSIPRFILIGPEGKIVNNNAPRPSAKKEIKELFNSLNI